MKKTIYSLVLGCLVALFAGVTGCDNSGESNFKEQYVLDGWMPLGHVIAIRLTKSVDIEHYYDNRALGVSGATVRVREWLGSDTTTYVLTERQDSLHGTYYAQGAFDTVKSGYDYDLRVEHDGHVITALTHRAPPPFRIDSCYIYSLRDSVLTSRRVAEFSDMAEPEVMVYHEYYTLYYQEPAWGAGVNLIIECMEPDWFSNDDLAVSGDNGPPFSNIWFWTLRTGNFAQVAPISLNFQGQHRVRAMVCDTAAYDYFQTAFPGDPTSNPATNVQGALGLFSVYDADTIYFCLTDPEADVVYNCQQ